MPMNHMLSKPAWICNFSGDSLLKFWKENGKKQIFEKNPLKTKINIYLNDHYIYIEMQDYCNQNTWMKDKTVWK